MGAFTPTYLDGRLRVPMVGRFMPSTDAPTISLQSSEYFSPEIVVVVVVVGVVVVVVVVVVVAEVVVIVVVVVVW